MLLPPQHSPAQNHVLAALPQDDYKRLLPSLEPIQLPLGWYVHGSGEMSKYLYFPTAGIVSNGASAGFAVTGREGVVGIESILGNDCSRTNSVTLISGHAYRMEAEVVKNECNLGGPIRQLLLRYTQAWITQLAQTAVCHQHHSVEQQLCHWLLMCLDRVPGNELPVTNEMIANLLGVRRETVTAAARELQQEDLIQRDHGKIIVRDRQNLKAGACECYGVVEREYARLMPGTTWHRHQGTEQRHPLSLERRSMTAAHLDRRSPMPAAKSETITKPKRTVGAIHQESADPRSELRDEAWRDMVSTAAYFRAEARSFEDGSAKDDWYGAEAELRERFGAADNDVENVSVFHGNAGGIEATGE